MCIYIYTYIYIYIHTYIHIYICTYTYITELPACTPEPVPPGNHQRGVQWKQGVVIYTMLYSSLLYSTAPIHCTPLPLHPPLMTTPYILPGNVRAI